MRRTSYWPTGWRVAVRYNSFSDTYWLGLDKRYRERTLLALECTLFRWAGSKRQLVPTLARYWVPSSTRYVEPFAGSAALFFKLAPKCALLGDLNRELIGAYRTLRRSPRDVLQALQQMRPADREFYYQLRALEPASMTAVERAARFIYLNRYCFNGLYRTNLSGQFNVPFGGEKTGVLPSEDVIMGTARRLRSVTFVEGDFAQTLALVRPGDFVYLDPPYWVAKRRVFREYDSNVFAEHHLARLEAELCRLEEIRIPFVLSYADSTQARRLARNRRTQRVQVRRNISGFVGSRCMSNELMITPKYMD